MLTRAVLRQCRHVTNFHLYPFLYCAASIGILLPASSATWAQAGIDYSLPPPASTQRNIATAGGPGAKQPPGIYPALAIGYTRQDNYFRTLEEQRSESTLSVRPSIAYVSSFGPGDGRHALRLGVAADILKNDEFTVDEVNSVAAGAGLDVALGSRIQLALSADFVDSAEIRGAPGSRDDIGNTRDEFEDKRVGGTVTIGRPSNRVQVSLGIATSELNFTNNEQQVRDRDTDTVAAGIHYNTGPKSTLSVNVERSETDFRSAENSRDSQQDFVNLGWRWEATTLTSISLKVGKMEKDFDDPARRDYDGTGALGLVSWQARPFTRVSIVGSRHVEESGIDGADYFVNSLLGINIRQDFTRQFSASLFVNANEADFSDDRQDDTTDVGLGFRYRLSRWLVSGLRYSHIDRTSTDPDGGFDDRILSTYLSVSRP
ncbi:MAG: outer membrane beta-barrel protein [Gammaproteobacteria bacterium]|nr:outer membrane beta-barrel protein [Gammaproteobacteria bacterium]MDH3465548.1 outer membrane beta-barrel protein [Gammaproteobacteria bacterium]